MSVQIDYKGLPPSPFVSARIAQRIHHLEHLHPGLDGGRVVVELANHRRLRGNPFSVKIELHVPGAQIVRSRAPAAVHKDVYVAIRDAFDATERLLQRHDEKRRREVKRREQA